MLINLDNPNVCKITKTKDLEHYEISVKCPCCGEWHSIKIKCEELFQLRCTGSVNHLKNPPAEREMLISGLCPDCWNMVFGQ